MRVLGQDRSCNTDNYKDMTKYLVNQKDKNNINFLERQEEDSQIDS